MRRRIMQCNECGGEVSGFHSSPYTLLDDEEDIMRVKEGKAGECVDCGFFHYDLSMLEER